MQIRLMLGANKHEKINAKISDENWTLLVQKLNQTKNIISLKNL